MTGIQLFGKPNAVFAENTLIVLFGNIIEQWVVMRGDKRLFAPLKRKRQNVVLIGNIFLQIWFTYQKNIVLL